MNRNIVRLLSCIAALGTGLAHAEALGPLVTPAGLDAVLGGDNAPVVLDIRAEGYDAGHIAGAVSAPYGLFRGPAGNPGAVPPVETLETTYEGLGLDPARPVVVVSQGDTDTDFGASARVYWTLKSSGFSDLSILNGGAMAWVNAGLPLSDSAVIPEATELSIIWDNRWTATTDEVARIVGGEEKAVLIDARPQAFFDGKRSHGAARRPGTLPGAENLPYTTFFRPGATAIDTSGDIAALKQALGVDADEGVVSFCNTGHWAATDWFALSEVAGIENVRLYPGSMVEYSQTDGEMANVPGLFGNLLHQLKGGN
ncbi:sulfurtransferase [Tropicimonas sp.]|uniref:sulfurtransferase n=1 Tax=Tropicimonas sp. TaxID=2067044 RepID=UPI003A84C920